MLGYIVRRLLASVPVLLGTTFLIFVAVYALPGDPITALAGEDQTISPAVRRELTERYGLDDPLLVQYVNYLTGLFVGDFGVDFRGVEVSYVIARAWPTTVLLALTAWVLMAVFGIGLGAIAGLRPGGVVDGAVLAATTVLIGIPFFVVAYVGQIVFGLEFGWFPTSGTRDGWPLSYVLPAASLAIFGVPELARLTRASILENRYADYVHAAVAKGLSPMRIAVRHVLRTSLIPVVSMLGLSLGGLLGGAVLVEGIFNVPGLGYAIFTAIGQQNGPVVVGIGSLVVLVFLGVNLLVDLMYGVLDPRVSLDRRG
ncbi:ABC transporter permease [Ruania rhizosphaerae]|uniref:ABC transporter permease n=1 Tax=Ruania rhizosphaerae TaxID=1840413 RepID=UPI00135AB0C7|nr:ABC transporter permease [Ruania rhizosphaerae]